MKTILFSNKTKADIFNIIVIIYQKDKSLL